MADERIDIYDEENTSLDTTKMKSEAHRDGLWHRAIHIWILHLAENSSYKKEHQKKTSIQTSGI